MSTEEPSRCCVCGEPTTKRCQACAKSGIDLYFCSPEHQKLVWKHHKEVCGPSAYPFRYPPLSQEEVDELLALEFAPVTDLDRMGLMGLLSHIQGGPSPELLARRQAALQETTMGRMFETRIGIPSGSWAMHVRLMQSSESARDWMYTDILYALREELNARKIAVYQKATSVFAQTPFWSKVAQLDHLVLERAPNLAPDMMAGDPSIALYRHRAVVLVALAVRRMLDPDQVSLPFLRCAFEQLFSSFTDIRPSSDASDAIGTFQPVLNSLYGAGLRVMVVVRAPSGRIVYVDLQSALKASTLDILAALFWEKPAHFGLI